MAEHPRKMKDIKHKLHFFSPILIGILLIILASACHQRTPDEPLDITEASTRHASLLQMQDLPGNRTLCRITNPWQKVSLAKQYLLVPKAERPYLTQQELESLEASYGPLEVLVTPLKRQTITAACHAYLLECLDALPSIGVLCDVKYVSSVHLQQAIVEGVILNGGMSTNPNAEIILSAQSQAIWISPFEGNSLSLLQANLPDVPIIYCADYMEASPLGRAEWMRFYGRLVGKTQSADSLFNVIETNYYTMADKTRAGESASIGVDIETSETDSMMILPESPYGATWFVPGGCSTMSQIYQDAGFVYPWSDDTHSGSLALAPEVVLEKANQAQVWLIKYFSPDHDWTLAEFLSQNALFKEFKAAQEGRVYGCNSAISNYFEVMPFRPDLLLEEMQHIRKNENEQLRFFEQLP